MYEHMKDRIKNTRYKYASMVPLSPGELSPIDKLQPDFVKARAEVLRDLYGAKPETTLKLLTLLYPQPHNRPWERADFEERFGGVSNVAEKKAFALWEGIKGGLAAYEAAVRRERLRDLMIDASRYPALYATQPNMLAAYTSNSLGQGAPATVSHHRHYHRHHRHHGG
jgi:hypothetical protein